MKNMKYRNPRYYHTCPCCGAHLDPGEHCDCDDSRNTVEYSKEGAA